MIAKGAAFVLAGAAIAAVLASVVLTGVTRAWALRIGLLDAPNSRSSHTVPVPRGGGQAIVATMWLLAVPLMALGCASVRDCASFLLPGTAIAIAGYIDDRRSLRASTRFAVHAVSCGVALLGIGGIPATEIAGVTLPGGLAGALIVGIGMVWCVNLYNFMDGIDGLAGGTAVLTGGALFGLAAVNGMLGGGPVIALMFAAASLGFLVYNWPPASIFMGDVGSGFLGFAIAWASVWALHAHALSLASILIVVAPFLVDATVTLLTRAVRGERVYEAHRSHLYQRLSRRLVSHQAVTLLYLGLELFVMVPLALWVNGRAAAEGATLALVYGLLAAVALAYGAGRPDER